MAVSSKKPATEPCREKYRFPARIGKTPRARKISSATTRLDGAVGKWYYFYRKVMEKRMESAITSKGQATIPKSIRDHLRLKPGDRVKFFVHPDGSVVLLPKLPVSALRGIVRPQGRPVTVEEMTDAAEAGAAEGMPRRKRR
jgi:AbrB family looped-hinge helix DNA binding protein